MRYFINAQSSVRIESEIVIHFDPFKIKTKANDADIIFITHPHFDHFSPNDIAKVKKENTLFVAPKSMSAELLKIGVAPQNIFAMNPGETAEILGVKILAVPAYNTNKPMHKKEYGWLGYIAEIEGKKIYVAGDIDAISEAEEFKADIAFVPIGGTYTMDYREAAQFINRMRPKKVIPYHYGSIVGSKSCGKKFKALVDGDIEVELLIV